MRCQLQHKKIVKSRKILCGFWVDWVKKVGKLEKISGGSIGFLASQFLKNQGVGGGIKCCYHYTIWVDTLQCIDLIHTHSIYYVSNDFYCYCWLVDCQAKLTLVLLPCYFLVIIN